jgi:acyl-coenzyme A thioesterase PaaI-like protein
MDLPAHQLTMTVLMTPDTANFAGNVHGGHLLKWLDQVAYACASRYAARYVVTVSVDQVTFREPIFVGELVTFLASVNHTGTSSMEIGIKVLAQDIRSQAVRTSTAASSPWSPWTTIASRWPCRRCGPSRPTRSAASKRRSCARPCGARPRRVLRSCAWMAEAESPAAQ